MKKAELLLPAGSISRMKTAVLYGADAVYAGVPDLSLRANSEFDLQSLADGIKYVHDMGKKVYLTLNLFTHNADVPKLPIFLNTVRDLSPDGVIVSDAGVFDFMRQNAPEIPLHISTQANVCSWLTVDFWKRQGAKLCVLGREVGFDELTEIRRKCPDIKLEMFIHGAMCMSYSGRCLMSSFMASRSANKGLCAHSCRWKYKTYYLEEEKRPNEFFPVYEDDRGTYIMNSKDLCLMPKLPQILSLGIDSLKVEGRHKSDYYVAMTARVYRKAIDAWYENPDDWRFEPFMDELDTMQSRGYTLGFFDGMPEAKDFNYTSTSSIVSGSKICVAMVREHRNDGVVLEVKNKINKGDTIEILSPLQFEPIRLKVDKMTDAVNGKDMNTVSAGTKNQAVVIPYASFIGMSEEKVKTLCPVLTMGRTA